MLNQLVPYSQPFEIFVKWLSDAKNNPKIIEPTAMSLSTISSKNTPSSRMVLLKKIDEKGFVFYTNFNSKKGQELKLNQVAALCFYWGALGRQVRVEGEVEMVSNEEADKYFASRHRESQIGAWASLQSSKMNEPTDFSKRIADFTEKFANIEVPRPQNWSGFRVKPNLIEFWQEKEFRLHERDLYDITSGGWFLNKLYP